MVKKLIATITAFALSMSFIFPSLSVSAKGASAGATHSVSTPAPKVNITKSTSTSKSNPSFSKSEKSTTKPTTTAPSSASKDDSNKVNLSKYKYKGMSDKGHYVKPENMSYVNLRALKDKPYYNPNTGFATGLLVAGGTMLVLDHITDDGGPVYANADTGAIEDPDKYGDDIQVVDNESTEQANGNDSIFIFAFFIILILGLLLAIFMNRKK